MLVGICYKVNIHTIKETSLDNLTDGVFHYQIQYIILGNSRADLGGGGGQGSAPPPPVSKVAHPPFLKK